MQPNNREKLILAAARLASAGTTPFTAEDLAVEAWDADPIAFGLAGYENQHVDFHAVISALSGQYGLVGRKLLDRVAVGQYQLAPRGVQDAKRIKDGRQPGPGRRKPALPIATVRHLDFLLRTTAWSRFRQGMLAHLTYEDAELFLLSGSLAETIRQVTEATADGPVLLKSGQEIDAALAERLRQCELTLGKMFFRALGKQPV